MQASSLSACTRREYPTMRTLKSSYAGFDKTFRIRIFSAFDFPEPVIPRTARCLDKISSPCRGPRPQDGGGRSHWDIALAEELLQDLARGPGDIRPGPRRHGGRRQLVRVQMLQNLHIRDSNSDSGSTTVLVTRNACSLGRCEKSVGRSFARDDPENPGYPQPETPERETSDCEL